MKYFLSIAYCLLSTPILYAQEAYSVEMADGLHASGKIYVVVGGLVTILLGIVLYLIIIDRKVSDIEKRINKK